MYNEHFGLQQSPFRITPDTRLFYEGGGRGEILDALVYAIVSGEGIVKVVGEVGTGKTMLCRMLEERLPKNVEIVYLANPSLKPDDILQAIALEMALDVAPGSNRLEVMHAMQERLLKKHADNRQVVVFVEEAQSMPLETLEEIRLLSNLETKREKLLQIVLFGQPELDQNLNRASIRQLKERITHSFYLEPLKRNELRDYVNFRMRAVGYKGPDVFRSNAYVGMSRASEGLTRRINILADKALLAAYANDRHEVTVKDVRKAIHDSQFESRRRRFPRLALAVGASALAAAAGLSIVDSPRLGAWSEGRQADASATGEAAPVTAAAEPQAVQPNEATGTADEAAPVAAPTAAAAAGSGDRPGGAPERPRYGDPAASGASRHVAGAPDSPGAKLIAAAARAARLNPEEPVRSSVTTAGWSSAESSSEPEGSRYGASAGADAQAFGAVRVAAEPASSNLISARLAVTRRWLAQADDGHYSIQLLLTARSQRRQLEEFLRRQNRDGEIDHVYVYETVIDERPYLGVLYREFASYSAAKRALENLPGDLKRHGPFIRNVRDVSSVS